MTATHPILVVDDDPEMRDGLRAVLHREGFAVETAANGREALDQLEAGLRPCVIVMDLMMPVMNGVEFRRQQLRDAELACIPVITYSGITEACVLRREPIADVGAPPPKDVDGILALVRQHCAKAPPPTRH